MAIHKWRHDFQKTGWQCMCHTLRRIGCWGGSRSHNRKICDVICKRSHAIVTSFMNGPQGDVGVLLFMIIWKNLNIFRFHFRLFFEIIILDRFLLRGQGLNNDQWIEVGKKTVWEKMIFEKVWVFSISYVPLRFFTFFPIYWIIIAFHYLVQMALAMRNNTTQIKCFVMFHYSSYT